MDISAILPPSEQYRLAAKAWVELDGAARILEETKSAMLSQRMSIKAYADMPLSHAERNVKASEEWSDFLQRMVDARTDANFAKVRMEYYRMKFSEWISLDATRRAEMKL